MQKVVAALRDAHIPQCQNDLRATGKPLCLLINFGRPKIEIRRVTAQTWSRQPSPSSPLIPFIRLKKKRLPARAGLAPAIPNRTRRNQKAKAARRLRGQLRMFRRFASARPFQRASGAKQIQAIVACARRHSGSFTRNGFFAESV